MFKFIKNLFLPNHTYYCPDCNRITETYTIIYPKCKCGNKLRYTDRISYTTKTMLEIKGKVNNEDSAD